MIAFLGLEPRDTGSPHIAMVQTLDAAARRAIGFASLLGAYEDEPVERAESVKSAWRGSPVSLPKSESLTDGCIRGLFSGGTFCYEAMFILQQSLGPVYSNVPLYRIERSTSKIQGLRLGSVMSALIWAQTESTAGSPTP